MKGVLFRERRLDLALPPNAEAFAWIHLDWRFFLPIKIDRGIDADDFFSRQILGSEISGSEAMNLSLLSDGCLRACIRHLKARDIRHCQGGTMGVRPRYDKTPRLEPNVAFNAFAIPGVDDTLATPCGRCRK